MPPICSLTQPATEFIASRREAATECPPPTTRLSMLALVSSTICRKRSLSLKSMSFRISVYSSSMSSTLSPMVLPFTIRYDTGSGESRRSDTMGYTEMPPVFRPIFWVSSTNDSASVPMLVRQRQKSGTSGTSEAGTVFRGKAASMYSTLLVKRSWRKKVVPLFSSTAHGMVDAFEGMSASASDGMQRKAAASSGVSCFSFSALVFSMSKATSSSPRLFWKAVSLAFSSASICLPRAGSGCSSSVTRCGFSSSSLWMSGPKTSSVAMRALNASRAAAYFMGSKASPSYNHADMERSMRDSPRGKRPVLFSRRLNSMVFTAASMASASNPSLANFSSVDMTSSSTFLTSSAFTPLSPMQKVGWRSSSSRPPPTSASPSPLSSRALRSGAALVPSIRKLRKLKPNSV
mmetsp:Transcript_26894/g.58664  ORF Transcript_26894/g.58664 Transcript_26894/m.58664 type:complete len:405 (-) Transcript_26894:1313-2527(-)